MKQLNINIPAHHVCWLATEIQALMNLPLMWRNCCCIRYQDFYKNCIKHNTKFNFYIKNWVAFSYQKFLTRVWVLSLGYLSSTWQSKMELAVRLRVDILDETYLVEWNKLIPILGIWFSSLWIFIASETSSSA